MVVLNDEQSLAAASRDARTAVVAGAGTGKTTLSIGWVEGLIRDGVSPDKICMLTFTRKAGLEMAKRLKSILPEKGAAPYAGTFHSLSSCEIRKQPYIFGFNTSAITTLDEQDSLSMWTLAAKEILGKDAKKKDASQIAALHSLSVNKCIPFPKFAADKFPESNDALEEVIKISDCYKALKTGAQCVDFDDLLLTWLNTLVENEEYRNNVRSKWTHFLIDEMQDNNQLQHDIINTISPQFVFGVGDFNQSIYGFRSAMPELMVDFMNTATVYKLSINYRSGQNILDVANDIISDSEYGVKLKSSDDKESEVDFIRYSYQHDEAHNTCSFIVDFLKKSPPTEICVLSRSSTTMSGLEVDLRRLKIKYRKYGGKTIADAAEVKDYLSFLSFFKNERNRVALTRALCMFKGIGPTGASNIAGSQSWRKIWPLKAMKMKSWLDSMQAMSDGDAMVFLARQMLELFKENYPDDYSTRHFRVMEVANAFFEANVSIPEALDTMVVDRTQPDHPDDCITLSTIHSAKGLEWDNVLIIGCGEKQIPHPKATESELAEERRLLYVAVTRARKKLILSYSSVLNNDYQDHSPFIPASCF